MFGANNQNRHACGPDPDSALPPVLSAFLCSRLIVGTFAYLGHLQQGSLSSAGLKWPGVPNWWLNPWTLYDSEHYLSLAQNGYQGATTAFFPLYPALLRLGGDTTTAQVAAGLLISNVSFLFALYVFYGLARLDYDDRTARSAVWILAFFPTTAFFSALYTESLFLLLALLSFYNARLNQWKLAGLFGLCAALTRNSGLLVFIALALEYLQSQGLGDGRSSPRRLLPVTLPLFGFLSVQLYLWTLFKIPLASVATQSAFYRAPGAPWEPVLQDIRGFFTFLHYDLTTFVNLLVIAASLALAICYRRSMRPAYLTFMLGLLLMNLCYYSRIPPYTTGTARYMSVAFPFFLLLGLLVRERFFRRHALPLAGAYLYICLLFSYLFGRKFFLG